MNALLGKILIYAVVAVGSGFGGYILNDKVKKPVSIPACPDCNCPEPTVSVQPFDVDKIKGLRAFNYAPSFTGSIKVAGVDSASISRMIEHSVDKAFQKYTTKKGKKLIIGSTWKKTNWDSIVREAGKRTDSLLADRIHELTYVDKSIFLPE